MRGPRWAYCVWPGLPQLWLQGSWSSLGVAASFALVLNLALVSTLVWTELLPPSVRSATWLLAGVMWTASAIASYRWLGTLGFDQADAVADAWYLSGVEEYLKGNWFEAEVTFNRLVARDPRDIEARLMLATLFRHTGRHDEAHAQLDHLQRLAGAEKWRQEVRRELELLAADSGRKQDDSPERARESANEWIQAA
jgi:tetratricopeptide (TPR) repeat protein